MTENATKRCSICGETKSVDEFHNDRQKADGKSSWCKQCTKAKAQSHRAKTTAPAVEPVTPAVEADPLAAAVSSDKPRTRRPLTPEQKAAKAALARNRRALARLIA